MVYTCRSLQFGENQKRVPGYEEDIMLSNPSNAPIKEKLVDPDTDNVWNLVFSYASGEFYHAGENVPAKDGAVIKSWYAQGGDNSHCLRVTPFIVAEGETGFVHASNFVDFSEPPTIEGSVNMDAVGNASVTAVVRSELSEYEKVEVSTASTNFAVTITTEITRAVFDQIFVYAGASGIPINNTVTVPKGGRCFALAVFKKVTSRSSQELGPIQWPKILKWEWPMIVAQIIEEIVVRGNADIYHHLSPKLIAEAEPQVLQHAVSSISQRIESLDKIKTVISSLYHERIQ